MKKNSLIIISILGLLIINIYEKIDYQVHTIVIDNIFKNGVEYNKKNYIGYIEIDHLNIKREIVLGINDENLKNYVCLNENAKSLNEDNLILAGHSIKNIFYNLHYIKLNDEIIITTFNFIYHYIVTSIDIVDYRNVAILDNSNLILITCMNDNTKRLIVKAKRI